VLTDTNLRSAADALWDKLWSGGLSNPLDRLPDFIETRGYISLGEGGQQIHVEEYRRRAMSVCPRRREPARDRSAR